MNIHRKGAVFSGKKALWWKHKGVGTWKHWPLLGKLIGFSTELPLMESLSQCHRGLQRVACVQKVLNRDRPWLIWAILQVASCFQNCCFCQVTFLRSLHCKETIQLIYWDLMFAYLDPSWAWNIIQSLEIQRRSTLTNPSSKSSAASFNSSFQTCHGLDYWMDLSCHNNR